MIVAVMLRVTRIRGIGFVDAHDHTSASLVHMLTKVDNRMSTPISMVHESGGPGPPGQITYERNCQGALCKPAGDIRINLVDQEAKSLAHP